MISVEEARDRILADLQPTPAEIVALADAWSRVTAAPVTARLTQPPADVSAMDGYALRAADGTLGAVLHVIGSAPAGHPFAGHRRPGPGGAPVHRQRGADGADAILLQEDATAAGTDVPVNEAVTAGRHIRRAGQDFAAGDAVVPAGRRADRARHRAGRRRQPSVAHRAPPPARRHPRHRRRDRHAGRTHSSRRHRQFQLARARRPGARRRRRAGRAARSPPTPARRSPRSPMRVHGMDMLVTTGGASVGDHDLVIESLKTRGLKLDFWQIAMRPGKPLLFGRLGSVPVLGLPGNPVSAMVCSILFLLPALSRLSGLPAAPPPTVQAIAGAALRANDHRADHLRATVAHRSRRAASWRRRSRCRIRRCCAGWRWPTR